MNKHSIFFLDWNGYIICCKYYLIKIFAAIFSMESKYIIEQKLLNKDDILRSIRDDTNFTDVTLACSDGKQLDAHRVILSSQSMFFNRLSTLNVKRDFLIYLTNISSIELQQIVDFIYLGQIEISEQDLGRFLHSGNTWSLLGYSVSITILHVVHHSCLSIHGFN